MKRMKPRSKQVPVVSDGCGKGRYVSEREAIRSALASSRKRGVALRVYR